MSTPRFPANPFTDVVPRRSATSSKAGMDQYRRLAAVEQAVGANTGVDTDSLNLYRALGSSLKAWSFDPGWCANATDHSVALASGQIYLSAMYLPSPASITGVTTFCHTAGVGTWGINRVGLYDAAGNRLALSLSDTSAWKAVGVYENAFSVGGVSTPYVADRGLYYAAILHIRTVTTTAPAVACRYSYANALQSLKTTAANPRVIAFGGQTDLPATLTLSSGTAISVSRWMGLY